MTATATLDFAPIAANTMVSFGLGSDAEVYSIQLEPDSFIEEIQYFEVTIATVGGTNSDDGTVDGDLNTAKVLILDRSCKLGKRTSKTKKKTKTNKQKQKQKNKKRKTTS